MEKYIHEEIQTREDIQVRFETYRDSNHLITNHWHNSMEIICICEGCMDVTINNSRFTLAAGDFVIINSADIHSTYCHENCSIILLQIPYQFLKKNIPEYDNIRFDDINKCREKNEFIRSILMEMKALNDEKPEGYSLRFSSLLYNFLYSIIQYYKVEIDTSVKIRTDKNLRRLENVMDFVKSNYASAITLDEAASAIALNPEYFCRFFKKYMGLTFLEYVNKVRLAHVYEDLMNTDLTITGILERNGCTNYKLFMKNFKSTYGCTPMQMRKSKKVI
ncbi:MAG: AraC family transcriptional regulator [Clostridiales bacterium]|nr:AraC family transcriptional regulator [Clostridiales bacterium]